MKIKKRVKYSSYAPFCLIILALCLASCAQIVPPQGGPRDSTPPTIVSTNFRDSMTNFDLEELVFKFDEVITAPNINSVVSISPLTKEKIEAKAVNKTLSIKLPRTILDDNTTYNLTVNGIQDVTEGNKVEPKKYLFSTGDYLDSLRISGRVISAEDNSGDTAVSVYLYPATDSFEIIRNAQPKFYIKVDPGGKFALSALPAGSYRIYALADQNRNFLYDLPSERIAIDTHIYALSDTSQLNALILFSWSDVKKESNSTGTISRGGRRGASDQGASTVTRGFYFDIDTSSTEAQQDIYKPLILHSTSAIVKYDPSLISVTDTTTKTVTESQVTIDSNRKILSIQPSDGWEADHIYRFFIRENGITDSSGESNTRASFYFTTYSNDNYSTLLMHFIPLDSSQQYVATWHFGKDTQSFILNTANGFDMYSPHILASDLTVDYFLDVNRNGKLDVGNFDERRLPEVRLSSIESYKIKKGWDHIYNLEAQNPGATAVRGRQGSRAGTSTEPTEENDEQVPE